MAGRAKRVLPQWARLFRLPNLATAAGDAVAGGAVVVAVSCPESGAAVVPAVVPAVVAAFAAGAAEFFLYLAGLADNDLVDEAADRESGSDRPIATGAISRRAAVRARAACFAAAAATGLGFGLGPAWWAFAAADAAAIIGYNRAKERFPATGFFLMGACRGLALLSGAAAAGAALPNVASPPSGGCPATPPALFFCVFASACWTLYVASITWLGSREEKAAAPLGSRRFVPAAFALMPFVPFCAAAIGSPSSFVPGGPWTAFAAFCGLAAATAWCRAVEPLGRPHGPAQRGRAVGRAIGGLLWMQTGLVCAAGWCPPAVSAFSAFAAACWLFRLASRRLAPSVTGS